MPVQNFIRTQVGCSTGYLILRIEQCLRIDVHTFHGNDFHISTNGVTRQGMMLYGRLPLLGIRCSTKFYINGKVRTSPG